jgi:hypothetical protein
MVSIQGVLDSQQQAQNQGGQYACISRHAFLSVIVKNRWAKQ